MVRSKRMPKWSDRLGRAIAGSALQIRKPAIAGTERHQLHPCDLGPHPRCRQELTDRAQRLEPGVRGRAVAAWAPAPGPYSLTGRVRHQRYVIDDHRVIADASIVDQEQIDLVKADRHRRWIVVGVEHGANG